MVQFTYTSLVFRKFCVIPPHQYHAIVRFFQQYEGEIDALAVEEQFVILCAYTDALFGLGDSDELLVAYAQRALEYSILYNLQHIEEEDMYLRLLYQKAVAHYRLGHLAKATQIAKQLLALEPERLSSQHLLKTCLLQARPRWVKGCWAASVLLISAACMVAISNILVIETLYANWYDAFNLVEMSFFTIAGATLTTSLLAHYYFVHRQIQQIVRKKKAEAKVGADL